MVGIGKPWKEEASSILQVKEEEKSGNDNTRHQHFLSLPKDRRTSTRWWAMVGQFHSPTLPSDVPPRHVDHVTCWDRLTTKPIILFDSLSFSLFLCLSVQDKIIK